MGRLPTSIARDGYFASSLSVAADGYLGVYRPVGAGHGGIILPSSRRSEDRSQAEEQELLELGGLVIALLQVMDD